jgi:hypothetical protein
VYLDIVTVASLPYEYEDRVIALPGPWNRLRLFALDPYHLALAKLERNLPRDRDDVLYLASTVPFDIDLLRDRYRVELRPYLGRPEREDVTLDLWVETIRETLGDVSVDRLRGQAGRSEIDIEPFGRARRRCDQGITRARAQSFFVAGTWTHAGR